MSNHLIQKYLVKAVISTTWMPTLFCFPKGYFFLVLMQCITFFFDRLKQKNITKHVFEPWTMGADPTKPPGYGSTTLTWAAQALISKNTKLWKGGFKIRGSGLLGSYIIQILYFNMLHHKSLRRMHFFLLDEFEKNEFEGLKVSSMLKL